MKAPQIDLKTFVDKGGVWKQQRATVRQGIVDRLGILPPIPEKVSVRVISRESRDFGTVEKLCIENGSTMGIPAWFALPDNVSGLVPAMLWCHWHGGEYDLGKEEIFSSDHTPEAPVTCFLKMGFAVLCIDAYGFGERNGNDPDSCGDRGQEGEHTLFKQFLWQGSTLWGQMVRDDRIAFRYLQQRSEVDGDRIVAAGLSMGATRTQWLMALEEELTCGIAIACMVRYRDLIQTGRLREHGMYFYVPDLMHYCDLEVILALAAPRCLLCLNGAEDVLSPTAGIETASAVVAQMYALYGHPKAFRSELFDGVAHECTPAMWELMKQWMNEVLY